MTNRPEPHYENDEELSPQRRPKWTIPREGLESSILSAVGRKYYHAHPERTSVVGIVKASSSLTLGGKTPIYATEWIEYCCEWAKGKRSKNQLISLLGLVNFIKNKEAQNEFVMKTKSKKIGKSGLVTDSDIEFF